MTDIKDETLLTLSELAEKLRVSNDTIRNYLKNDNFPRMQLEKEYRFYFSDVMGFFKKKEEEKALNASIENGG